MAITMGQNADSSKSPDSPSLLESLGTDISLAATQLSACLNELDYPQPSFNKDAPTHVLPSGAPEVAHELRRKIKQQALTLFYLASGPSEYIAHVSMNHQYTICLRYLLQFQIFTLVPREGSIPLVDLAGAAYVPLDQLTTVMRMAATSGLFKLISPTSVTHSAASLLIADNPSFASWGTCISKYVFDASAQLPAAAERWGDSCNPAHSAFNLAFTSDMPFGKFLGMNPPIARMMGQFVKATELVDSNDMRHLQAGYAWENLGKAIVVDVSSASLESSVVLAKAFPSLSFEIQPQERAVNQVESAYNALSDELQSRITILPPKAGLQARESGTKESLFPNGNSERKVFLLRHVLHNMPDSACQQILKCLLSSLDTSNEGRIIIMDIVLSEPDELNHYEEAMLQTRNLIQLELANNRGRTAADWKRLTHEVKNETSKLKVLQCLRPAGSDLSILEIGMKTIS